MNNKKKPAACTQPPWKAYLPNGKKGEILIKIRQETEQAYGQNYDSCPKRMVCIGKSCLGRPLPTKSKTFQKYFSEMKKNLNIVNDELVLENCDICQLRPNCNKPCQQINDYLARDKKEQIDLTYKETIHNIAQEPQNREFSYGELNFKELPWDCVPELNKKVYEKVFLEKKNMRLCALELNLADASTIKQIITSTFNKLSEYYNIRKFLKENPPLTKKQKLVLHLMYIKNMNFREIEKATNLSKSSISAIINRVKNKYNLKIEKFHKRIGNVRTYKIPRNLYE